MESVTRFITQKLKLKVNEAKSAVARFRQRLLLSDNAVRLLNQTVTETEASKLLLQQRESGQALLKERFGGNLIWRRDGRPALF
jgi:RNA-directed DNA polymerase